MNVRRLRMLGMTSSNSCFSISCHAILRFFPSHTCLSSMLTLFPSKNSSERERVCVCVTLRVCLDTYKTYIK